MHGYGVPPGGPRHLPSDRTLVSLRVLFIALNVLTCGFLAWTSALRVAVVTRTPRSWVVFVVTVLLNVTWIGLLAADPEDEGSLRTDIGMIGSLATSALIVAFYLFEDIRHYAALRAASWYGPQAGPLPQGGQHPTVPTGYPSVPGYGYPTGPQQHPQPGGPGQTTQPHQTGLPQQQPGAQPQPGYGYPAGPHSGQTPPPQRLGQVRAELDELSELLHREERGHEGDGRHQEPGR
ncbi:hypothetical protein [Streptomyces sp. NPDC097619]|uniref:hypothetical protein n=1 Tax=Streptomyces sp. NPDC097619 TaxID=3157228 RepID=UPI0033206740